MKTSGETMFGGTAKFIVAAAIAAGVVAPAGASIQQAAGGVVHRVAHMSLDPDDNSWSAPAPQQVVPDASGSAGPTGGVAQAAGDGSWA
ncbi:hypothetical protein OG500_37305 [Kitasatospora sp. NBC_01250]|uniref:hypothetical protein n=1 Tax=Kitasatospora sp. NBC_01250 TaxID=2903571 RepID=UPI002E32547A|nr:hypothetical protein [Kitasatospora sp. NBC_01250]